jgi:hypothetical protein
LFGLEGGLRASDVTGSPIIVFTHVDDICLWIKDPMAVIKSLERFYMSKSVGKLEYYVGGNVEFLGEAWKNQVLGLAGSTKTYIQNIIPKI